MIVDGLPSHPTNYVSDLQCWLKTMLSAMLRDQCVFPFCRYLLGRPLQGRSLIFPVSLYMATRRLTSPSVISKRAATAEKDGPVCAAPTLCHHIFRLATSGLPSKQQQTGD